METKKRPKTNIVVTERDKQIMLQVFLHKRMTIEQIALTIDPNWIRSNLSQRLKSLYDHKYLDRPPAQKGRFREKGGSFPLIYGLGTEGAKILKAAPFYRDVGSIYFSSKNKGITREYLEHSIMLTEIIVQARVSCRDNGMQFLDEDELIRTISKPGRQIEKRCGVRGWRVPEIPGVLEKSARIIPDRMIAFEFPHLPKGKNRLYYFVEADNGNESQISDNPDRPTIARKMVQYRETAKCKLLQDHFPAIESFGVLFITRSAKRSAHMQQINESVTKGWRNFWVTDMGNVETIPFFDISWHAGPGGAMQSFESHIKSILRAQ